MMIHCKYDELISPKKLKPFPKNRNKHPKEQIERLSKILKYQGIRAPIVVSKRSGCIVKGHGTLEAAKSAGFTEVPIVYQDFEDEDQEYLFVQSDNAIAAWAEIDLSGINADLAELGPFDIDLLGVENFELEPADKYGDKDADATPEVRETSIHLGDLFRLGEHRLLCGDSTNKESVEKLMSGEKADMVFTDPPYNHASDSKLIGESVSKGIKLLKQSEWDKDFEIETALELIGEVLAEDSSTYIFSSWILAGRIWNWMAKRSNHYSYCVWHKTNPRPCLTKRQWNWSTEIVCYMTRGKHTFNFPEDDRALNLWAFAKEHHTNFEGHPTQKPVKLCEHPINISSNSGDLVLDLFLGSGSTLIACEKTNRKCYGMEIDPQYCQVIIDRWEKFTGQKAKKL